MGPPAKVLNLRLSASEVMMYYIKTKNWDIVFRSGPTKICGRQTLKDFKGFSLPKQNTSPQIF